MHKNPYVDTWRHEQWNSGYRAGYGGYGIPDADMGTPWLMGYDAGIEDGRGNG